jgi:hypothetical protein
VRDRSEPIDAETADTRIEGREVASEVEVHELVAVPARSFVEAIEAQEGAYRDHGDQARSPPSPGGHLRYITP